MTTQNQYPDDRLIHFGQLFDVGPRSIPGGSRRANDCREGGQVVQAKYGRRLRWVQFLTDPLQLRN